MPSTERIRQADAYLSNRVNPYGHGNRRVRFAAAARVVRQHGDRRLPAQRQVETLFDVGAGWTEFDWYLRLTQGWRGRYIPVDACIDGVDLERWIPPRRAEFFVALELIEHLDDPYRLVVAMCAHADRAVIISTPNPDTTDVLGMDATHKTPIDREHLERLGFDVRLECFYGQPADSLFGVWTP